MVLDDEDLMVFIRKIYSTPLSCGKTLKELSTYNKFSMWWVADDLFFHFIYSKLKPGRKNFWDNVPMGFLKKRKFRYLMVKLYRHIGYLLVPFLDIILYKITRGIAKPQNNIGILEDKKIFFTAQDDQWRIIRDYEKNHMRYSDQFFDPIITELQKRGYNPTGIYPIDLHLIKGLIVLAKKKQYWNIPHIPLNAYWSFKIAKEEIDAKRYFSRIFALLKEDEKFGELCKYQENDLSSEIIDEMEIYFIILFPHLVKYIEIAKNLIIIEKPRAIIIINEQFWWERSLQFAAKSEQVPTIAIQHGAIHQNQKSYMLTPEEISENGNIYSPFCPVPDIIAVFGPYYYRLLTMVSSYPKNRVVVTGQPKYDFISTLQSSSLQSKIITQLRIDGPQKKILWTTQLHGLGENENSLTLECIVKAIKQLNNGILFVKLHPDDPERCEDKIINIAKSYGISYKIIPKKSAAHEIISVCDLMITKSSTTALEAIALKKPLIILNIFKGTESDTFTKDGVAREVTSCNDLPKVIESLLSGDINIQEKQSIYCKEHLFFLDGKSSERFVDELEKLLI